MDRRGFSLPKTIIAIVVLVALTSMTAHTVMSWVPRNLQNVDGTGPVEEGTKIPDLAERLNDAIENAYEVTITEEELNRYISSKLELTQSSIVDDYVKITGVYVDLKPNLIDVSIEREFDVPNNQQADGSKKVGFMPFSQTVSMQIELLTVDSDDGGKSRKLSFPGGNFGKSPAPGLLVTVVKSSFDVIAERFSKEIKSGYEEMTSVIIGDGVITLDPRPVVIQQRRP
ncbi:MAG: hypothetical protein ABGY95_07925 [Rubritalea sp.]|uniref:hypothetical protein n=1 Tax=Rubritalea sp. TaxID=2109375 RepID=UPI003241C65B